MWSLLHPPGLGSSLAQSVLVHEPLDGHDAIAKAKESSAGIAVTLAAAASCLRPPGGTQSNGSTATSPADNNRTCDVTVRQLSPGHDMFPSAQPRGRKRIRSDDRRPTE
jgi:hypothetical protein